MRALTVSFLALTTLLAGTFTETAVAAADEYSLKAGVGAEPGTNRLLVVEKGGRIRIVENG